MRTQRAFSGKPRVSPSKLPRAISKRLSSKVCLRRNSKGPVPADPLKAQLKLCAGNTLVWSASSRRCEE